MEAEFDKLSNSIMVAMLSWVSELEFSEKKLENGKLEFYCGGNAFVEF